jgi:CcmD family protein
MIQGGEEFIWAAYGISWAALALYSWSIVKRLKAAEKEDQALTSEGEKR